MAPSLSLSYNNTKFSGTSPLSTIVLIWASMSTYTVITQVQIIHVSFGLKQSQ